MEPGSTLEEIAAIAAALFAPNQAANPASNGRASGERWRTEARLEGLR